MVGVLAVHLAVLLLPAIFFPIGIGTAQLYLFLLGASLLCSADLGRLHECGLANDRTPAKTLESLLCMATGLVIPACWWTGMITGSSQSVFPCVVGMAMMVAGAAIRRQAVLALAVDFVSDVAPPCRLKTDGIHAVMRHPSETGLLLSVVGGCTLFASIAAWWLLFFLLLPLSMLRVRLEEASLRQKFGEAWEEYRRSTGRYLPTQLLTGKREVRVAFVHRRA